MQVLIAGGKLQGIEAAYLAKKCGFKTRLVDKNDPVPAKSLSDAFFQADLLDREATVPLLEDVEMVIPALENGDALEALRALCDEAGIPFVFQEQAYRLSSSKHRSKELFRDLGLPTPRQWPECSLPVIAKPSCGSGSKGVKIFHEENQLNRFLQSEQGSGDMVIEEFVPGRQFSLEVVGSPERYVCPQVTELEMDAAFDCKRVTAPAELPEREITSFKEISLVLAHALGLQGVMDVEAVLREDGFTILEMDVRLPSQTPSGVYWSTGFNIIENLGRLVQHRKIEEPADGSREVILEHLRVTPKKLEICGENILATRGNLQAQPDFFGADEAITDYQPGKEEWAATLIVAGENRFHAAAKRDTIINIIMDLFKIEEYSDPQPPSGSGTDE